jgi:hypothetical protein
MAQKVYFYSPLSVKSPAAREHSASCVKQHAATSAVSRERSRMNGDSGTTAQPRMNGDSSTPAQPRMNGGLQAFSPIVKPKDVAAHRPAKFGAAPCAHCGRANVSAHSVCADCVLKWRQCTSMTGMFAALQASAAKGSEPQLRNSAEIRRRYSRSETDGSEAQSSADSHVSGRVSALPAAATNLRAFSPPPGGWAHMDAYAKQPAPPEGPAALRPFLLPRQHSSETATASVSTADAADSRPPVHRPLEKEVARMRGHANGPSRMKSEGRGEMAAEAEVALKMKAEEDAKAAASNSRLGRSSSLATAIIGMGLMGRIDSRRSVRVPMQPIAASPPSTSQ